MTCLLGVYFGIGILCLLPALLAMPSDAVVKHAQKNNWPVRGSFLLFVLAGLIFATVWPFFVVKVLRERRVSQ